MHEKISNVVYAMHSGLALLLDVYQPPQGRGVGILYINGSGWHAPLAQNAPPLKDTPQGMPWIEALCAAGYTVFAINHRAAPRFRHPAAIDDARRAVRFMRHHAQHYGIQADQIGVCGGSSGGHLACLLGVQVQAVEADDTDPVNLHAADVQCVVARAPVVDLRHMLQGAGAGIVASYLGLPLRGEAQGGYAAEQRSYAEASPLVHVSAKAPPVLLIHGDADDLVPYAQSELMQAALQAQGVAVELLPIAGGGHGPDFPGAQGAPDYLAAATRWFDKHLRAF
jgi:acetyl esterase/lipase